MCSFLKKGRSQRMGLMMKERQILSKELAERYQKSSKKQKYFCHGCGRWFVPDDGFKRMRYSPEIISRAVHQHVDGFSLFKTQYHLLQHDGIKVSRWTISQWTKRFSLFLKSTTPRSNSRTERKATL